MLLRMPLLRATVQSYRNAALRAYHRNPQATVLVLLLGAAGYLALVALQVSTLASTVDTSTLSRLQRTELSHVALAGATAVAAIAVATHLLLGMMGTQSPSLAVLAAHKHVGWAQRAWSLNLLDLVTSTGVAVAVVGPVCALTVFQVGRVDGSGVGPALLTALVVTLAAALSGASTSLLALGAVRALGRRSLTPDLVQAVAMIVQGLLVVAGVGLVLAGNTGGLLLLCPVGVVMTLGVSTGPALLLLLATGAWTTAAVYLAGIAAGAGISPVRRAQVRLQLPGERTAPLGVVSLVRDPLYLASVLLVLVGALVIRLLVGSGELGRNQGGLLLMVLVGLSGLSMITSVFALTHSLWVFSTRPYAVRRMVSGLWATHGVAALVVGVLAIAVAGYAGNPGVLALGTLAGLLSSWVALNWAVRLFGRGTSAEHRGVLLSCSLGAIVTVGVLWAVLLRIPQASDSWPVLSLVLLAVCAVLSVPLNVLTERSERRSAQVGSPA